MVAAGGGGLFSGGNNDEHSVGRGFNTSLLQRDFKSDDKSVAGKPALASCSTWV